MTNPDARRAVEREIAAWLRKESADLREYGRKTSWWRRIMSNRVVLAGGIADMFDEICRVIESGDYRARGEQKDAEG